MDTYTAQITLVIKTTTLHAPNEGEAALLEEVVAGEHVQIPEGAQVAVEILQPEETTLQFGQPGLAQP